MNNSTRYIWTGVAALVVLAAIWFYMLRSGETPMTTALPPAEQTPAAPAK